MAKNLRRRRRRELVLCCRRAQREEKTAQEDENDHHHDTLALCVDVIQEKHGRQYLCAHENDKGDSSSEPKSVGGDDSDNWIS